MATMVKRQLCECKNCGNEAEMEVTCTLPEPPAAEPEAKASKKAPQRVKGTATCTHCGNEADMWVDL